MFALTRGEIAIVAFIFALVWGAGFLPRLGEHLGARLHNRKRRTPDGAGASALSDKSASDRG